MIFLIILNLYLIIATIAATILYIFTDKISFKDYFLKFFKAIFLGLIWPIFILFYFIILDEEKTSRFSKYQ